MVIIGSVKLIYGPDLYFGLPAAYPFIDMGRIYKSCPRIRFVCLFVLKKQIQSDISDWISLFDDEIWLL